MTKISELKKLTEIGDSDIGDAPDNSLKGKIMQEAGKAVELLYNLDIYLSKQFSGNKDAQDVALSKLRTEHIRKALDALHTGDLLDLADAIKGDSNDED